MLPSNQIKSFLNAELSVESLDASLSDMDVDTTSGHGHGRLKRKRDLDDGPTERQQKAARLESLMFSDDGDDEDDEDPHLRPTAQSLDCEDDDDNIELLPDAKDPLEDGASEDVSLVVLNSTPYVRNTLEAEAFRFVFGSAHIPNLSSAERKTHIEQLGHGAALPYSHANGNWVLMGREAVVVGGANKRAAAKVFREYGDQSLCGGKQASSHFSTGPRDNDIDQQVDALFEETVNLKAERARRVGYMIVVGEGVEHLSSPLFTYRLRLAQLDPDVVRFSLNPRIPVYGLRSVLEKRPLLDAKQMTRDPDEWLKSLRAVLKETVAADLAVRGSLDITGARDFLQQAIHVPQKERPGAGGAGVHPTMYEGSLHASRQERGKLVSEFLKPLRDTLRRFKKRVPAGGLNIALLFGLLPDGKIGARDALLADVEKGAEALTLVACGLPLATLSALSRVSQQDKDAPSASQRVADEKRWGVVRRSLSGQKMATAAVKGVLPVPPQANHETQLTPLSVALMVHLDPRWFADYASWYRAERLGLALPVADPDDPGPLKLERNKLFRAFMVSDQHHKAVGRMQTFDALTVPLLTKGEMARYFSVALDGRNGLYERTQEQSEETQLVSGETAKAWPPLPYELSTDEAERMRDLTIKVLDKMAPREYVVCQHPQRTQTYLAVSRSYHQVVSLFAKALAQVVQCWTSAMTRRPEDIPAAMRVTSPVVVKASYVYGAGGGGGGGGGHSKQHETKEITALLWQQYEGHGGAVGVLGPKEEPTRVSSVVSHCRVLVLRAMEMWDAGAIRTLARQIHRHGQANTLGMTHVVVLGRVGMLANPIGEAILRDLVEVSSTIDERAESVHGSMTPYTPSPTLLSVRYQPIEGDRTQSHLPKAWRDAQLQHNAKRIHCAQTPNALVNALKASKSSSALPPHYLIVGKSSSAGLRTAKVIRESGLVSLGATLDMARLSELRRRATSIGVGRRFVCIVFADIEDATVYDINTALAHANGGVFVLASRQAFEESYYRNSSKSDRATFHLSDYRPLADAIRFGPSFTN